MKINAFGKKISRDEAYELTVCYKFCEICNFRDHESLCDLMMSGLPSLEEWSDKDLEEYISTISVENLPDIENEIQNWRSTSRSY